MRSGAGNRNRTYDLRITNAPLYQLSYSGGAANSTGRGRAGSIWPAIGRRTVPDLLRSGDDSGGPMKKLHVDRWGRFIDAADPRASPRRALRLPFLVAAGLTLAAVIAAFLVR